MSTKIDGDSIHVQQVFRNLSVSTITTAGNVTYTASQLIDGIISRDCSGASRTDTTPTAAQIVSAMVAKNSAVTDGSSFHFYLSNESDGGAEHLNLTGGTGVTVVSNNQIKRDRAVQFLVLATNTTALSEAVSIYALTQADTV